MTLVGFDTSDKFINHSSIGCPRKNQPLFVKYFLDYYTLKIIAIFAPGVGNAVHTKGRI